ncbi:hypothetical protein, partial [Microbacterium sp. B19]|uniref:hypothetical protein n=1 Tax=Microbacterium sp. B19 TaxID=96765 RepID=UPI0003B2E330
MSDFSWALPASIALLAALVIAGVVTLVVRARRRSPRAAAAAADARSAAEAALARLDDAVNDLDVAFEAAVADEAPADLRRGLAAALRGRDRGFEEVAALATSTRIPAQRRTDAVRLRDDLERRRTAVEQTRERLSDWSRAHGSIASRIAAVRARREEIARTSGDPARLVAEARPRFDAEEWTDADRAERGARAALARADAALKAPDADPFEASLALRRADRLFRAVEDAHRFVLQAAENATAEVSAAEAEIASALELAEARSGEVAPDAVERLRVAAADLRAASVRRPSAAIEVVARVREVRDEVLGEAPSARQRLEAARAALPGTLACARRR